MTVRIHTQERDRALDALAKFAYLLDSSTDDGDDDVRLIGLEEKVTLRQAINSVLKFNKVARKHAGWDGPVRATPKVTPKRGS